MAQKREPGCSITYAFSGGGETIFWIIERLMGKHTKKTGCFMIYDLMTSHLA
jgi:hypothetical protein